ncbi:kelch-like protein 38 isoform X1 [Malaclemys terrapin pileata]|uniref:kelch-like protein 38 isoform X1 n=2 Tax=Malaclemys terrapin pileata TaxID=2991368 RepID=UPI0023A7A999|nr:kelch-like protein 38 isoform X1 [Malaclemys terrapin pileata]XP_053877196.1 kelch-like protein 38 isoform X1 [Malaclemys terrapin pileata]
MEEESAKDLLFKDQDFSSELLRQLNVLRQNGMLTDVTLCTSEFEIPCHRNVLAASSPYFKAMFCNNFKESCQAKVDLKGMDSNILYQIVLYVYTGEILITAENVLYLMEATSMLQYIKLFQACSLYLQDQLTPENCLSMIRLSEILNCQNLNKKAKEMALKYFPEVASSEDLKELCALELINYLGDDELCGEEEQVFETLMVWIRHDLQARQGYIQDLFKKVRLQYVHPTFLFHFIANDSLIQSSPACRSILESARRQMFSLYSTSTPDIKPMWHVPRRYSYQEFLIIIGGRKDNQTTTRDVLLYDEKTNQWLSLAKHPVRLYKASAVSLHSNIYVLGGMPVSCEKSPVSDNVHIFSLKLNQWRLVEPMLVPRYSHRSIAYKNYIFSIGGIGENQEILNSVERYDSIYNIWENMANMPVAVLHPAVAAKDQRIYLFGGEDIMQNPVRLIQVYHISRNMWFRMETRMVKNVCAPAVVIGDRIIIVGGYTRRIIAYDTKANKFVKCADMKDRRMHHGAAVIKNKLYVTGGRCLTADNTIQDSDSLDCYDPETDTWTSKGKLPHKLFDHGCLALQCVPYSNLL